MQASGRHLINAPLSCACAVGVGETRRQQPLGFKPIQRDVNRTALHRALRSELDFRPHCGRRGFVAQAQNAEQHQDFELTEWIGHGANIVSTERRRRQSYGVNNVDKSGAIGGIERIHPGGVNANSDLPSVGNRFR